MVRPASSTAEAGMFSCSHVSVITIAQLSMRRLGSPQFNLVDLVDERAGVGEKDAGYSRFMRGSS